MGTLPLSLTGLTSGNPLPGNYLEVQWAAGVAGGDLTAKRVLILAPSTAAGSIVQDTEVYGPIGSEDEAIAKGGPGSPLHRMVRAFLSVNRGTQVFLCAPTRSAGVSALLAVTVAGAATGSGVARIEVCEEVCDTTIVAGDTPTIIAAGLAAAINARTHLPVTAANVAGVLTITAKAAGPEGNAIRVLPAIVSSSPTGITISPTIETPLASGATAATYTSALATILASDFDLILPHTHSGTSSDAVLTALKNQVASQALPTSGIRQKVIAGTSLSASSAVTLAQSLNAPRLDIVNLKESRVEPSVLAALEGAVFANTHFVDPSTNLDGYGARANDVFPLLAPRNKGSWHGAVEQTVMLNGGVTPIAVTVAGTPYIVRQITSYSLNGATADYRVRDSHRVTTADRFADDLSATLSATPWRKLTDDPPPDSDVQPPPAFATPRRAKVVVESLVRAYVTAGWLDPAKLQVMLDGIATGIDPTLNTRLNIRVPLYSVNLIHQTASLVAESSAAA